MHCNKRFSYGIAVSNASFSYEAVPDPKVALVKEVFCNHLKGRKASSGEIMRWLRDWRSAECIKRSTSKSLLQGWLSF